MLKISGPSATVGVFSVYPEEAGWAGLVSCQSGEAVLAIGDWVTVCADTGTLHTVQCSVSGQETG